MHKAFRHLLLTLTLGYAACASATGPSNADEAGVRNASSQFYSALNQMFTGDVTQMKEVWSHADDVGYMGPNDGVLVGWNQVSNIWDAQAAMKLGGKVEAVDVRVTVGQDIAVTPQVEHGENTLLPYLAK